MFDINNYAFFILKFCKSFLLNKMKLVFFIFSKTKPIWVSEVKQMCYVDIYENGTEAAAVTICSIGLNSCSLIPAPPIRFHVKSPYIYFIYQPASQIVLFSGIENIPSIQCVSMKNNELNILKE